VWDIGMHHSLVLILCLLDEKFEDALRAEIKSVRAHLCIVSDAGHI
jgi:hypothetical protein